MPATDNEIFDRYLDQPGSLPSALRARMETACHRESIELYAMVDLDAALRLTQTWVGLSRNHLVVAKAADAASDELIQVARRTAVRELVESPGLSCTVLRVYTDVGEHPFATLRYTHRQRRALGHLQFVLQRQIEGEILSLPTDDGLYAGAVTQPVREAQASVRPNRFAVVWRLLGYLRPYRGPLSFGMAGAAVMTLARLVPPWLTGKLLDETVRPFSDGRLAPEAAWRSALTLLGGLAAALLTQELAAWVRLRTMAVLGEHVARDLRTEMYDHLHKLSVAFFSSKQTGSIISRVGSDSDRIWDFIAFGVVELSLSLLLLAGLSVVLLFLDWRLGMIMTVPLPLVLWAIVHHGQRMHGAFLRAWRKWSHLTDALSDTIPGIRVVKAFDQSEHEKKKFEQRNVSFTTTCFQIHGIWTGFWPVLMLSVHAMTLGVWVFALPRLLHRPGGDLSVGTFVSFLLYMSMYLYPIEVFGQMTRLLNRSLSSAHRIFNLLDTEPQMPEKPGALVLRPLRGRVEFDDVSFGYDPVRSVVRNVSFTVEPGELIGLVGPSGSGKTTLINLLVRFYDVSSGQIRVDGVPVADLELGTYRRQVGMVLQDSFLFHGSIAENISYGLPAASVASLVAAARAANAHDFICRLPHGYDTMVGERGHTLSGGERQRISIARAILHDPRILILDEATSAVDTETEFKIQEALDRLVAGRTVFAIAHRLSTLRRASRLLVMKEGRLVEAGAPAELLRRPDGLYRRLHTLQAHLQEA